MGNNEHSLDRIERNAAYAAEVTADAEAAPDNTQVVIVPRGMGLLLLSEQETRIIATALLSQINEFRKLTTGGTESTDQYFTGRVADLEEVYDTVLHFGWAR